MSPKWKSRMRPLMIGLTVAAIRFAGPVTGDAAAAALPKDPCALLKPVEVQQLAPSDKIGSGVQDNSALPMAASCKYTGSRNHEWGETSLLVIVTDISKVSPGGLSPDDIKQSVLVEAKADGPDASVIPGIGDGAVFTTKPKVHEASAKAYVVKGKGVFVLITFHGGSTPSQKDNIIALLKDAVGRL